MADNIDVTPGTGATVSAEEIAGKLFQRIKIIDSTAASVAPTGVAANPFQVSLANTAVNSTAVKVDGSAVTQPVSGTVTATGPLTDTQLRASAVPVSGTVATGGLTDTQLRATAVPVSGPLTDTQLRATPVPISGTVSGGGGTQYTEDVAAVADPIGTMGMYVRKDTPSATVSADGDNIAQRGTNFGAVYNTVLDSLGGEIDFALENGGNLAALAATVRAEDEPSVSGQFGLVALSIRQDTPANTSGADGDYESLKLSAGRLWTSSKIDTAIPAGTNNIGAVIPQPTTAGGLLNALMGSADGSSVLTNAAQAIKASAGQLYGWFIYNPNATAIFVSIYNVAAASVTVGTTNPYMSLCIPPTSAANILGAVGIEFTNAGFSAAATTTGGGNTAPSVGLEANFFYK